MEMPESEEREQWISANMRVSVRVRVNVRGPGPHLELVNVVTWFCLMGQNYLAHRRSLLQGSNSVFNPIFFLIPNPA